MVAAHVPKAGQKGKDQSSVKDQSSLPEFDRIHGVTPKLFPIQENVEDPRAQESGKDKIKAEVHDEIGIDTDAARFFKCYEYGQNKSQGQHKPVGME
jgi:hypothetical protein